MKTRTLEIDGFCVLYDPLYNKNSQLYPCKELQKDILHQLPKEYVFIDYVYKINNVALSTFHRDVTSSQHNYNTTYPVYTVILYKYTGDLLSVCPRSHKNYPFAWSSIYNISGKPGTVFLFDCDLLHAGQTNKCKDREVLQYKLCHKDDLQKLNHLQGIHTEKTDICVLSYYNEIMRKLSYYFEFPINYLFYPLMIKREDTNNILGAIQTLIPLSYYNNSY
jgi:ectoine hydroxylase-related dioxygenase (phytanoyl-CoA dioxygenase family)